MESPSYIPETLDHAWFKDPEFLAQGLRSAIANADIWWAKQFFGHILKNDQATYFLEVMPYIIASTCYYKFYTMMHTIRTNNSPRIWWSCIEDLTRSIKTMDAVALASPRLACQIASISEDSYMFNIIEPFDIYCRKPLLPETLNVVGRYPVTFLQIKYAKAVEFLMQTRRTPYIKELSGNLIITEPTKLPYKYCFSNKAYERHRLDSSYIFDDVNTMDFILSVFVHYASSHLSVSIQPSEGDPPPVHTNNFIYQFLVESLLSDLGITLDNLMEFCDIDISCGILGVEK